MPVYRQDEKRFHFIHIPRTAGRFVESVIEDNNFKLENDLSDEIEGVERLHLHRDLYEKYLDIKGITNIAIIRNPIDRFFSCSIFLKRMYGNDIQEAMEDPIMFSMMLKNFPLTQAVNWFRPLSDFITEDTYIWKFENGFKDEFEEWISDVLNFPFTVRDVPYKKLSTDETNKLNKSDRLIENIKQFWREDIEQFYPELATSL
tara:strand:- start:692 stop:1300 length:609 start_codon:yes stop_codon:yes gene_type:complete